MGIFGSVKTDKFADKIECVAAKAGLKVIKAQDNLVSAVFRCDGGRTQSVMLAPVGELAGCTVVSIFSPAAPIDGPLSQDLANRLLQENGNHKIGYWSVISGIAGKTVLGIEHSMILDTLDPEELNIVLNVVADEADKLEKELTGKDNF
ncbi:hypothetical protein ACFL1X_12670 [Candidatus Hydrogenedentota bacterium]